MLNLVEFGCTGWKLPGKKRYMEGKAPVNPPSALAL